MLKPSEIFALVLRIIGVIVFLEGFRYIADFFLGVTGYFVLQRTDYAYYVILGMGYLLVGMYLARGASAVVDYAYPTVERDAPETVDDKAENAGENHDGV